MSAPIFYNPRIDSIIQHCLRTYGGTISLNGNILWIKIGADIFKINTTDKARFGKYTLFHRNKQRNLDGKYYYHCQMKSKNLEYLIYAAITHEFNKVLGITESKDDYKRFCYDATELYDPWCDLSELGGWFFY